MKKLKMRLEEKVEGDMLKIKEFVKVKSLDEAYELNQVRSNVIIGGMMWLKMQDRSVGKAIDLSGAGLDYIKESSEGFEIGAMTTLRELEMDSPLDVYTHGAVKEALRHIVGVQFRNLATVGGSVFGRFGFSDVLTLLMSLGAAVSLYKAGNVPIEEFAEMKYDRDILTSVLIPVKEIKISYKSIRNNSTDFPVINCAVSEYDGEYHIAVGARPHRAVLFNLKDDMTPDEAAEYVYERTETQDNIRGSATYRKEMTRVLVKRALNEIISGGTDSEN